MRTIKVLFPFVGDSVGGSHWSILGLYRILDKSSNIDPVFVLHSLGPLSDFLDTHKITYQILPINSLAGEKSSTVSVFSLILRNFYSIYRFIYANNIDIVHGNDLRINLSWSSPTFFSSSKYVWHQRQIFSKSKKWYFVKYLANHLITISYFVHKTTPRNIKKEFKSCINNPFNISNLYEKKKSRAKVNSTYNIADSDVLIGYVGRIVSWKHVEDILYALSSIVTSSSVSNIHLLIVGTGDSKYLEHIVSIVDSENLNQYVTMTGFIDNPSFLLASLDLLIASSHNEPFGRVLVESMLQKTLVLSSSSGAHTEIISHGVDGFLYDKDSSESLHDSILKILFGDINKQMIIEAAYQKSVDSYSAVEHAQKVSDLYTRLIKA
jgi:glycosyltransferase involved in cell wall biosynthesis